MAKIRPEVATCTPPPARPPRPDRITPRRSSTESSEFHYQIVYEREDIIDALRLVHMAYVQQGLIDAHPAGLRLTKHHLLTTTEVLAAKSQDGIICTASLVRDNSDFGLPMESIYAEEVAIRRERSRTLAEASCLACRPTVKTPLSVVTRVMALTIQCAKCRGVDELLAVVHPDHADFYIGFFGFQSFGGVKLYPSVRHNPAVAIALDLHRLQDNHPKGFKRAFYPAFTEQILLQRTIGDEVRDYLRAMLDCTVPQERCV